MTPLVWMLLVIIALLGGGLLTVLLINLGVCRRPRSYDVTVSRHRCDLPSAMTCSRRGIVEVRCRRCGRSWERRNGFWQRVLENQGDLPIKRF